MEDAKLGRCRDKGGNGKCVSPTPGLTATGQSTGNDNGLIRYHFENTIAIL